MIKEIVIFVAGAVTGGLAVDLCLKRKYEQEVRKTLEEERENLKNSLCNETSDGGDEAKDISSDEIDNYREKMAKVRELSGLYSVEDQEVYEETVEPKEDLQLQDIDGIFYDSRKAANLPDDYKSITLTCYSDGVLYSEDDQEIVIPDYTIGVDNLKDFMDDSSIEGYVINNRFCICYDLVKDDQKSFEALPDTDGDYD